MTGYGNYQKPVVTGWEAEIIALIAVGCRDQDIAEELGCTLGTISGQIRVIRAKLEAANRAHLVTQAFRHDILTLSAGLPALTVPIGR